MVVHWKGWQRVGMIKVADLISEFMDRAMIEETYGIKCNFLEVMQIRNAIPWIRAGPIVVQNLSPGDINYEGNPLNVLNCSSKKLYDVVGGTTDLNFKSA